jgi:high-affinity Fe2+/Pb2+ permease
MAGLLTLVVSTGMLVVSTIRLQRNEWKDRQTGGLHTDYTNAAASAFGIAVGLWILFA